MRALLTGVALLGCLIGGLIAVVMLVAAIVMWFPVIAIPVLFVWYFCRKPTKRERRRAAKAMPVVRVHQPHHARPPMPSAMDNPYWF